MYMKVLYCIVKEVGGNEAGEVKRIMGNLGMCARG